MLLKWHPFRKELNPSSWNSSNRDNKILPRQSWFTYSSSRFHTLPSADWTQHYWTTFCKWLVHDLISLPRPPLVAKSFSALHMRACAFRKWEGSTRIWKTWKKVWDAAHPLQRRNAVRKRKTSLGDYRPWGYRQTDGKNPKIIVVLKSHLASWDKPKNILQNDFLVNHRAALSSTLFLLGRYAWHRATIIQNPSAIEKRIASMSFLRKTLSLFKHHDSSRDLAFVHRGFIYVRA